MEEHKDRMLESMGEKRRKSDVGRKNASRTRKGASSAMADGTMAGEKRQGGKTQFGRGKTRSNVR